MSLLTYLLPGTSQYLRSSAIDWNRDRQSHNNTALIATWIIDHWRGRHSLAFSVIVTLLVLGLAVQWLEPLINRWFINSPTAYQIVTVGWLILTRLILFPWQIVGALRAAARHFEDHRQSLVLYATQGLVLAYIALAFSYTVTSLQKLSGYREQLAIDAKRDIHSYSIKLDASNKSLTITGELEFGIVDTVTQQLNNHPQIVEIILASPGGQIYEGRGLGLLFQQRKLNTVVNDTCASACTTAFIGGVQRTLGSKGKIGFHRYGIDSSRQRQITAFYSLTDEQAKDLNFFRQQGVDENFLQSVFVTAHESLHFPTPAQLLKAGFVTQVLAEN